LRAETRAGDVAELNRLDRVDNDVAVFHRVAAADLDALGLPDAHAAADSAAADSLAKTLGEEHDSAASLADANCVEDRHLIQAGCVAVLVERQPCAVETRRLNDDACSAAAEIDHVYEVRKSALKPIHVAGSRVFNGEQA